MKDIRIIALGYKLQYNIYPTDHHTGHHQNHHLQIKRLTSDEYRKKTIDESYLGCKKDYEICNYLNSHKAPPITFIL